MLMARRCKLLGVWRDLIVGGRSTASRVPVPISHRGLKWPPTVENLVGGNDCDQWHLAGFVHMNSQANRAEITFLFNAGGPHAYPTGQCSYYFSFHGMWPKWHVSVQADLTLEAMCEETEMFFSLFACSCMNCMEWKYDCHHVWNSI